MLQIPGGDQPTRRRHRADNSGGGKQLTSAQQSAKATLTNMLDQWGLASLAGQMWQEYLKGTPIDQIMSDIRNSDAYKQRFPGMADLVKSGHAITEADYIAKESTDMSLLHAYGLDSLGTNRQFLGNLIGNMVSTTELQTRLDTYQQVVQQLPHEVKDYLQSNYGVHAGDLLHFWLNPDEALPELQRKAQAAEVGGAAAVSGFGFIDPKVAARLAGIGVNFTQALSGFENAGELKGLTQQLPGDVAAGGVSQDDLINGLLAGDSGAALRVQRAQAARKAQFGDSEAVATTNAGAVGLSQTGV